MTVQHSCVGVTLYTQISSKLVSPVFDVEVDVEVAADFELKIPLMSCRLCRAENGKKSVLV